MRRLTISAQKFVMETNLDGLRENTMYGIRVAPQLDSAGTVGALSREVLHRVGPRLHDNFELKPIKVGSDLVVFQWSKPSGVQVTRYKVALLPFISFIEPFESFNHIRFYFMLTIKFNFVDVVHSVDWGIGGGGGGGGGGRTPLFSQGFDHLPTQRVHPFGTF